ncbi:hypothetical protein KJ781_01770 [Patescibacteria group bacterium]|nr:hypothetical protein [Patescibacteria group bacterium]MBU1448321.1 hypothetical protein [Patescibacteria group bacterium]MBU2613275.1 hypothetical protein [Patescibacteria group bacterium]
MAHPTTPSNERLKEAWAAFESKMTSIRSDYRDLLAKVDGRATERKMTTLRKTIGADPRV